MCPPRSLRIALWPRPYRGCAIHSSGGTVVVGSLNGLVTVYTVPTDSAGEADEQGSFSLGSAIICCNFQPTRGLQGSAVEDLGSGSNQLLCICCHDGVQFLQSTHLAIRIRENSNPAVACSKKTLVAVAELPLTKPASPEPARQPFPMRVRPSRTAETDRVGYQTIAAQEVKSAPEPCLKEADCWPDGAVELTWPHPEFDVVEPAAAEVQCLCYSLGSAYGFSELTWWRTDHGYHGDRARPETRLPESDREHSLGRQSQWPCIAFGATCTTQTDTVASPSHTDYNAYTLRVVMWSITQNRFLSPIPQGYLSSTGSFGSTRWSVDLTCGCCGGDSFVRHAENTAPHWHCMGAGG
jgi:hypothetical protein